MGRLARIDVHPVKSLDPRAVESAAVVESGALEWDRRYAILDADGDYVNGMAEPAVHRLRAEYDLVAGTITVGERDAEEAATFHMADDRDDLASWLSTWFGYEVRIVRDDTGLPDDTDAHGPTVVSTGTLAAVGDWFDLPTADVRRRFRPNLVIEAPAFWEDRLYADREHVRAFDVGDVTFEGVTPCSRCVVPTRDPDTGEATPGDFRERFVRRRRETLPGTVEDDWYDHYFRLCVNTRLPADAGGDPVGEVAVGDDVTVGGKRPR